MLVAVPPDSVTGLPRLALSVLNWTVPVAVFGLTVAVKMTDCPTADGLAEEVKLVVVAIVVTISAPKV